MDEAEADVLAYMTFPAAHRTKLHSTDEMDKPFVSRRAIFVCAGDVVAKSGRRLEASSGRLIIRAWPD